MSKLTPTQVQENFITYFRLFAGLPGMMFVESPVTWATSPEGASTCMILGAKLTHDGVDELIDEALNQIGQHADAVDWFVFPDCQPGDLG